MTAVVAPASSHCLRQRAAALVLALLAVVTLAAGACSSSNAGSAALASHACSLNSDCSGSLICALGRCRVKCVTSADCNGGSCIDDGRSAGCQPLAEKNTPCSRESDCPTPLACASDYRCRNLCETDADCNVLGITGRLCAADANGVRYCGDPPEVSAGLLIATAAPNHPSTPVMEPTVTVGAGSPDSSTTMTPDSSMSMPGDSSMTITDASSGADTRTPFMPNADAGPLGFMPSNFNPLNVDGGMWGTGDASAPVVHVSASCSGCLPGTAVTIPQNDPNQTLADLYVVNSLTVDATAQLTLTGPRPIILAVLTTVDIQGQLIVSAGAFAPGGALGPGAGGAGGGGGYCGMGGNAGALSQPGPGRGNTYGSATISPLAGGSAGASTCSGTGGSGGRGGGALQIVAGTAIFVRQYGSINAGGGGGGCYGSGAGSGGAILLEAPSIVIAGNVAANGGGGCASSGPVGANASADGQPAPGGGSGSDAANVGVGGAGSAGTSPNGGDGTYSSTASYGSGGGGGGGAGRIRINTASGSATITGIVSPSMSPATPCATQGVLSP